MKEKFSNLKSKMNKIVSGLFKKNISSVDIDKSKFQMSKFLCLLWSVIFLTKSFFEGLNFLDVLVS